jgi:hypothetical protein
MADWSVDEISPDIPYSYKVGGGYPESVTSGRDTVDVLGLGSVSMRDLRAFQESARPGYAFGQLGGARRSRRRRKSYRRHKNTRNTRKYR